MYIHFIWSVRGQNQQLLLLQKELVHCMIQSTVKCGKFKWKTKQKTRQDMTWQTRTVLKIFIPMPHILKNQMGKIYTAKLRIILSCCWFQLSNFPYSDSCWRRGRLPSDRWNLCCWENEGWASRFVWCSCKHTDYMGVFTPS